MKPKASPQMLQGEEGQAPVRPSTVPTSRQGLLSRAHPAGTDLCAKPWAAATGSTFRAGSAPGAAQRARPGRGARQRRRCGGPGSRGPTADAAAVRSRGHPCRAPAPARRRLPGAARPGPGGGSARGRRARGAEEAASGVTGGGGGGGAGQQAGGLGSSAGGRVPSRRPPCGSIVCGGKQRRLGDSGARLARGSPPRPPPTPPPRRPEPRGQARRPGPERSARLPAARARAGHPGRPDPRAHTHRPGHAPPGGA